ncbi:MAG: type VI secretion protein IcmF/TssM N-terminal domain-containing protein [Desulfobacterales bacterium]
MKKFFKILLISLLILIAFFIPVIVAVLMEARPFSGLLFSLACLTFILLFLLLRALWLKRREKKFIDGILEDDKQEAPDKQVAEELSNRWKEAVSGLKKSNLRYQGNPLYVLPWYMIIGDSGSGKTTAIKNSGLTSRFSAPSKVSGVSGTRNCDWWFFEQAVFIDTAGRYAIHPDEASDREEWRLFLSKLAKYRKKEPLNGLIISVSAANLLKFSAGEIEEEGKRIRARIEELMQALGAKFPVYVLVTKCDLIYGWQEFCRFLPDAARDQALGYLNEDPLQDSRQVVDSTFQSLEKSMSNYRLRFYPMTGSAGLPAEAFLFPEEFSMLKDGLARFVETAFDKTVYKEEPHLRGIYFTSARQEGLPHSYFMESVVGAEVPQERKSSDKSYFLYDLFSKIMPSDRKIYSLTQRARQWKRKLKIMKLAAWAALTLTICGFLTWSFATNLTTIKQFQKHYSGPPVLSGEFLEDVNTLEEFRQTILDIEHRNDQIRLPGFGLNHCEDIEKNLKEMYCRLFQNDFMAPYDKNMTEKVVNYTKDTPDQILAKTFAHYIRRINLLKAGFEAEQLSELKQLPVADFRVLVPPEEQNRIPKLFQRVERQYLYYLFWADRDLKKKRMEDLHSRLEFLATKEGISMNWLVAWCNEYSGAPPVRIEDFWPVEKDIKDAQIIEPAYTVEGSKAVKAMIAELEEALKRPLKIEKKRIEFDKWYRNSYISQWINFAESFDIGRKYIAGRSKKKSLAKMMAAGKGPYFNLLEKISSQLEPCAGQEEELPELAQTIYLFDEIKKYAAADSQEDKSGVIKEVAKKSLRFFGRAGRAARRAGSAGAGISIDENSKYIAASAEGYNSYVQGLKGISEATVSTLSSYKLASRVFGQDPATGDSPVYIAKRGLDDIEVAMREHGLPREVFSRLIKGPFDFLWDYVCKNAGCHIQKTWDEKVLSRIEGVRGNKEKLELLFGENGYVDEFTAKDIAPFISRSSYKGYYAKTAAGQKVSFRSGFFTFLTKGAYSAQSEKSEYEVGLEALPTDTNPGAKIIPHSTRLELQCAKGDQILENYNYPVSKTFVWSPKNCGDVILEISVGDLTLREKYSGSIPFARFLKHFSKGRHIFEAGHFRDEAPALKRMGIKYIKVRYNVSGAGPVIKLLGMSAGDPPRTIVPCLN